MPKGAKFGGRQKGTRNKDNQLVDEIAKKLGVNPFEILCRFAAGDWQGLGYDNECYFSEKSDGSTRLGYTITPEMRLKAAAEASKYLFSQKKAVELSSAEDSCVKIEIVDYTKKG